MMMKKMLSLALCCALLCLCVPCFAEDVTVVSSFYPIHILTQNVLAGVPGVAVQCMTAPSTGCLHDYQLLTGDMRTLSGASAFVICGAGMESFLDDVTGQFPELPVVDCSQGVELIAEGAEDEMEYNAHIWLAPQNAAVMVKNIETAMIALLPQYEAQIAENAARYIAMLEALDDEMAQAMDTLARREMVTFHAAFSYFAHAYGLNVVAVVTSEPDEPVSPRALAQVVTLVKQYGNPPLFAEEQYADAALETVRQETGAPVYYLDPMVTGDGALDTYETVMRGNLETILEAMGKEEK